MTRPPFIDPISVAISIKPECALCTIISTSKFQFTLKVDQGQMANFSDKTLLLGLIPRYHESAYEIH